MSTVIARMNLDYFADDGVKRGMVQLFAPKDEGTNWTCSYQLKWPGHQEKRAICGEDSMQALTLALKMVPVAIQITDDFKAGRLGHYGKRLKTVVQLNKAVGVGAMKGFGK
jgi:hypothetical protein